MRRGLREPTESGAQSGIGGLGALLGLGLTLLGWHAAHSNYRNGYLLASPSSDARLHTFGWWLLPLGLALFAVSLGLALYGFRRPQPRWVLVFTIAVAVAGAGGFAFAALHYESLSSVCACDGG